MNKITKYFKKDYNKIFKLKFAHWKKNLQNPGGSKQKIATEGLNTYKSHTELFLWKRKICKTKKKMDKLKLEVILYIVKTFSPNKSQLNDLETIFQKDNKHSQKKQRVEAETSSSANHTSSKQ